jgi:hypothetical protein
MHKLEEQEISTQIDSGAAPRARRPVRIAAAAAVGLALLAIGLVVGVIVGRLQPGTAEQAASASAVTLPPAAKAVPALSWKDDYATRRHHYLGTLATSKTPMLNWKDDYGTRHHITPVQDPMGGWHDYLGTR